MYDTDKLKIHLNEAEHVNKPNFYLHLQKTKLFCRRGIIVITDINLYVPVATWSNQDNAELLRKWGFKRTINWNKYLSKINKKIKPIFRLPSWSQFSKGKQIFCFIVLR